MTRQTVSVLPEMMDPKEKEEEGPGIPFPPHTHTHTHTPFRGEVPPFFLSFFPFPSLIGEHTERKRERDVVGVHSCGTERITDP